MKRSYRVLARLGEGGMATVYLALLRADGGFRKLVALKVLRDQPGLDVEGLRELFAHEARVAARCHHRNVVQIHDVCDLDGKPALSMEYLDGHIYRQVRSRAAKSAALPLFEQMRILAEAAHGLHHVHTLRSYEGRPLGLVHCDVSPENVFITYDGQVKLLDFGIAQAHGERPAPPGFRGKLSYLAPELIKGAPVDARADVFALGAMLWEAISNASFGGGPGVDDLIRVRTRLEGGEPNIRIVQPGTPESLAAIVDRAVALDPAQRFADAETFACALENYLQRSRPQPSAQSLSRLVTAMFERERTQLRLAVEPQLQLADQWDREHESAADRGARVDDLRPLPFSAPTEASFIPPPPPSGSLHPFDPSYASPADTVSPPSPARASRVALIALVATLSALGGALLMRDDNKASERPDSAAAGGSGVAPAAPAAAASQACPAEQPAARSQGTQVALEQRSPDDEVRMKSDACVAATRTLRSDLLQHLARDLVRAQAREERHRERRARRRAAQCAAGRTEKC